jgi:hypothetical protein
MAILPPHTANRHDAGRGGVGCNCRVQLGGLFRTRRGRMGGMYRNDKQIHYEYGVVGLTLAAVYGVAYCLILGEIEPFGLTLLVLFAAYKFWTASRCKT